MKYFLRILGTLIIIAGLIIGSYLIVFVGYTHSAVVKAYKATARELPSNEIVQIEYEEELEKMVMPMVYGGATILGGLVLGTMAFCQARIISSIEKKET